MFTDKVFSYAKLRKLIFNKLDSFSVSPMLNILLKFYLMYLEDPYKFLQCYGSILCVLDSLRHK